MRFDEERLKERRERRAEREYESRQANPSPKASLNMEANPAPEVNPDSEGDGHPSNPEHQSLSDSDSPLPSGYRSFWEGMVAKDAPRPGFWPWMYANETRFSFCIMFFGIFDITAILLILRYLYYVGLTQFYIDTPIFVGLVDILLVVIIVMLIPIGVAYSISGKRKD